ncbi:MAG: hypothetical protein U0939_09465 [Pirellulales bacterium]
MKTFHEWLAMREGLWLNDKNAVIGLSRLNPLPKNSAVNKILAKKSKPQPSGVPLFKPWKPAEPAKLQPLKPAQPAKIVMQRPKAGNTSHLDYLPSFVTTYPKSKKPTNAVTIEIENTAPPDKSVAVFNSRIDAAPTVAANSTPNTSIA